MPKKSKGKITAKKSASRKPAPKKIAKKKALKKTVRKKTTLHKTTKKKAVKKKPVKKKALRTAKPKAGIVKKTFEVEPGPPQTNIPPVEEPAVNEEAIGTVNHYYSHLGVAVVQINKGVLKTGETIRFKGHTTDFVQQVESMEYEHGHVDQASAGQSVGLKVKDHVREHDIMYRLK